MKRFKTITLVGLLALVVGPGCSGTLKVGGFGYDVKSIPPDIASAKIDVQDTTVEWMFNPWLGIETLVNGVTGLIPVIGGG